MAFIMKLLFTVSGFIDAHETLKVLDSFRDFFMLSTVVFHGILVASHTCAFSPIVCKSVSPEVNTNLN
jgi:hypothetical protein